jgi:RNA recognition motif-containing protein
MIDKRTMKSRGFGFVMFADPAGRDEAISHMHDTELDTRRISVTKAIPMDQTLPGTPAAALGAGRREGGYMSRDRYSRPFDRGGYDRGYERGGSYDRYAGGDRYGGGGAYGGARTRPYEPRYSPYGSISSPTRSLLRKA